MRVDQLMTSEVVTVKPDTPLKDVAAILAERRIAGVPVCDDSGGVVGVLSEADLLWKVLGISGGGGLIGRILNGADRWDARVGARVAADAMSSPAVTIAPSALVTEAAKVMIGRGINRLPVVENGRLVGIVARADLVRAFQRSDEEIEREIDEDVLLRTLWVDPAGIEVTVSEGQVELGGKVENRTTAELIEVYVGRVPGVVSVRSELTWELDDQARRTKAGADRLPRRV